MYEQLEGRTDRQTFACAHHFEFIHVFDIRMNL